jgi:hypothetical protein
MEDPRLDANAPTPTNPEPGSEPSKVPLPIPWISTDAVPEVPLVRMPTPRCR